MTFARTGASIDYEPVADFYVKHRRPDPRIEVQVLRALGDARTVVNVGAGTGSYEPSDRYVLAVEPSAAMRAARPASLAPAIDAVAEALPLDDDAFDAATAFLTVHHWEDPIAGLRELRRVARQVVVVLTLDPERLSDCWLIADYLPEVGADDRQRFPGIEAICDALGGARVEVVPIPRDCSDGFFEAYFGRPEAILDPTVRAAQSGWRRLPERVAQRAISKLDDDLRTGRWDERHGDLRQASEYHGGLRLIVANKTGRRSARRRSEADRKHAAADIVLRAFAAVERRDAERLRELYHRDVEFRWPTSLLASRPEQTWDDIWDPLQPTERERRMSPRLIAASEREVVVLWHQRGRSPEGKSIDAEVLGLYEIRDHKFFRAQMFYFDTAAVLRYLESAGTADRTDGRDA